MVGICWVTMIYGVYDNDDDAADDEASLFVGAMAGSGPSNNWDQCAAGPIRHTQRIQLLKYKKKYKYKYRCAVKLD